MKSDSHSPEVLLIACIGLLSQPARDYLNEFLDSRFFDLRLHDMVRMSRFPGWFDSQLQWDGSQKRYRNIKDLLRRAAKKNLIQCDGLSFTVTVIGPQALKLDCGIPLKTLRSLAAELDQLLLEAPPDIVNLPESVRKKRIRLREDTAGDIVGLVSCS